MTAAPERLPPDRLTIRRLMLLTAGVGVALMVFRQEFAEFRFHETEDCRAVATALLFGCSLPGPLFAFKRRGGLGPGGWLWMSLGLGAWLLLPPAIPANSDARTCLFLALPLAGLWMTLAAAVGGYFHPRHWGADSSWCERMGLVLGLYYSPLGIWLVVDLYRHEF